MVRFGSSGRFYSSFGSRDHLELKAWIGLYLSRLGGGWQEHIRLGCMIRYKYYGLCALAFASCEALSNSFLRTLNLSKSRQFLVAT